MENYSNDNFVAHNPSEKALRLWESSPVTVNDRRRRPLVIADRAKSCEVTTVELKIQPAASVGNDDGSREVVIAIEHSTQDVADKIAPLSQKSAGQEDDTQCMVEMSIEPSSNVGHTTQGRRNGWTQKVSLEWIFVFANFILELLSTVLDRLSSEHNSQYAPFAMLISFVTLVICIAELIYKGRKEEVYWGWRGILPSFYHASGNNKHFGSFKDIFGSVCALGQCIVTAINHARSDGPIEFSVIPILFAFGLIFSKI